MKRAIKRNLSHLVTLPPIGWGIRHYYGGFIPYDGLYIDVNYPAVKLGTVASIRWGLYEKVEVRFVQQYLRRDLPVVELGSSLGVVTCAIRRILQPECPLIAVEANPALISPIRLNLFINDLQATVLNLALDNGSRDAVPFIVSPYNGRSSVEGYLNSQGETVMVPSTTLTNLVCQFGIEDGYTLVSDVEGSERNFIYGHPEALKGCQQIIIELHETQDCKIQDMQAAIVGLGFRLTHETDDISVFERQ